MPQGRTGSISEPISGAASPFQGIAGRGFRLSRTGRLGGGTPEEKAHRPNMESPVELDAREAAGISVQLLWDRRTYGLSVVAHDLRLDEWVEIVVAPDEALEVFRHPYAYVRST
jgi:hypothetical protein